MMALTPRQRRIIQNVGRFGAPWQNRYRDRRDVGAGLLDAARQLDGKAWSA
jgi:hypothetical protein